MRLWLRSGLAFLALTQFAVGAWQLFLPRSFYDDGPAPGHAWVALVPPYSEHLMRDLGALNLAIAVVAAVAAVTVNRLMAATMLIAYLVCSVPHLVFHMLHLEHFPRDEAITQTVALTVGVVLPVALLVAVARLRSSGHERSPEKS